MKIYKIKCKCGETVPIGENALRQLIYTSDGAVFQWRCLCGQMYFKKLPDPIELKDEDLLEEYKLS